MLFLRRHITILLLVLPLAAAGMRLVRNDSLERFSRFSGSRYIKAIEVFKQKVYFATANGLYSYDRSRNSWAYFNKGNTPLPSSYISSLAVDHKQNHLWIATSGGLARYAPEEKKEFDRWKIFRKRDGGLADNEIAAIAVDDDYVWVGTRFWGVSRYDKALNRWRPKPFTPIDGLGANRIHALVVDGKQLWAATDDGLSLYDRYTELWSNFNTRQGLSARQVTCISSDGKGIWAGTYGGGLNYFDKETMKFKVYRPSDGLADSTIFAVKCDGNSVWVATFGGLSRYVYGDPVPWKNFSRESHKLIDNETTALAIQGNLLWIGTEGKGISLFDKRTPQVVLTGDTGYSRKGTVSVFALIEDAYPIVSYRVLHRASIFTTHKPTPTGVTAVNPAAVKGRKSVINRKIAEIDVSKMRDNFSYDLRLEVVNTRGIRNYSIFPFTVDKTAPVLDVEELPLSVRDREIFIRGTYLELYLDRILISVNKGDFQKAANLDRKLRSFSHKIRLNPGENEIRIRIIDLGRNIVTVTKKLIYDPNKPVLIFSREMKKGVSTTPEFTIKGKVKETYPISLYLMPGKIHIPWKADGKGVWKFEKKVNLAKGVNRFEVVAVDQAGSRGTERIILNYNAAVPGLSFDSGMPRIVPGRFYTVKGSWDDKDLRDIIIEPGSVKAIIDWKRKTFQARINLKNNLTRVRATAFDHEDNKQTITMTVTVDENLSDKESIKTTVYDAQENYRLYIKHKKLYDELLPRYKKLLLKYDELERSCAGVKKQGDRRGLFIPGGQAVFFAPYRREKGDTMESLAKTYLKDPAGKRVIAGFNDRTSFALIRRRGSLLVPTAPLIRHLFSVSHRADSWAVIDTVAEAFNTTGPGRPFHAYKRVIAGWLKSRKMLTGSANPADGILTIRGRCLLLLHPGGSSASSIRRLRIRMVEKKALFGYIVTFHGSYIRFFRVE